MLLLDSTIIPERLTSFTAECLAVRDNCVASKHASKYTLNILEEVRASARTVRQARLVSFAVGCIP